MKMLDKNVLRFFRLDIGRGLDRNEEIMFMQQIEYKEHFDTA